MAHEIKEGDVVCLKSQKDYSSNSKQTMTVGSAFSGSLYNVHWFYGGELKTATIHRDSLHKIE